MTKFEQQGKHLKSLRKKAKLTQEALCAEMGGDIKSPRSFVSQIEKGHVALPQKRLKAFAKAVEVNELELVEWYYNNY